MRVTVLTENTTVDPRLTAEHGLSLLLDVNGARVLFDCGQSDAFARNAAMLGEALDTVDAAVLSHGHYDHGGGIPAFLERNATAPVYLSDSAFGAHYNGDERYIGLDPTLKGHPRLRVVHDRALIADGITVLASAYCPLHKPSQAYGLTVRRDNRLVPDPFDHEQCLWIEHTDGRRILVSGCSHRGVLNWMEALRPDVFIGGFHFMKLDPQADRDTLAHAAETLASFPCQYYSGHCTGDAAFAFLKDTLGDRLLPLSTGISYVF